MLPVACLQLPIRSACQLYLTCQTTAGASATLSTSALSGTAARPGTWFSLLRHPLGWLAIVVLVGLATLTDAADVNKAACKGNGTDSEPTAAPH
jgi:hypothetical protein